MKKYILSLALSGLSVAGYSQFAPPVPYSKAYLEANNIRSSLMTLGNMWYDPATGNGECEYPKGSGKHASFAAGLWIGGFDAQGSVRTAAAMYNSQGKRDYYSGILNANGTSDTATSTRWQRIWNIRRATIDSFQTIVRQAGTLTRQRLTQRLRQLILTT